MNFGHLNFSITVDDPKAYQKPWTVTTALGLRPDTELLESFCEGQQKTLEHRVVDPAPPANLQVQTFQSRYREEELADDTSRTRS